MTYDQAFTLIERIVDMLFVAIVVYFIIVFKQDISTIKHILARKDIDNIMTTARIVAQFRQSDESREAKDHFSGQTTAEVIKQVTDALEAITVAKNKDVKIIISNDKINQEGFEIKLSYRMDDPV